MELTSRDQALAVLSGFGADLHPEAIALLDLYAERLFVWNDRVNLISRNDTGNIWTKHILHSLLLLTHSEIPSSGVLDIGTGGGFPGIPIAICKPDVDFLLVDSVKKKVDAVTGIVAELGLKNVKLVWSRAESLPRNHGITTAVCRAVATLGDLIDWSGKVLDRTNKGELTLLCLKGGDISPEVATARRRFPKATFNTIELNDESIVKAGLEDKKIITVNF